MNDRFTRPRRGETYGAGAPARLRRLLAWLGAGVLGLVLFQACGRSGPSTDPAATPPTGSPPSVEPGQPLGPPGSPAHVNTPAAPAAAAPDLQALTQAVRRYSAERRRVPGGLDEVVAAGYIKTLPPPPPGMRYTIDPKRLEVMLVKR
ncbi:hypothetical protein G4L39_06175 [Limisphaera ngatamarikiensis]|uniref:Uncharacterized protein n=1 Tax=Limisphaera ngatamarikiensis TaxID=1324935 RepID=A0A6M1RVZ8_9BACT|nr:hypothetical protein [Limisphaera ngatamarikiensis]NGO38982.1 hypothetical protein [Limisphaera ngatamarikiensis]